MRLAFSLIIPDDPTAGPLLESIRAAGFDGVEPTFGLEGTLPTAANVRDSAAKLRAMADGAGLKIPSMRGGPGFWTTFASSDAKKRAAAVELAEKAFDALKMMGGDTLLIVPGQWDASQSYDEVWTNALQTARRIGELAEKANITAALENVENRFLFGPREWTEFLDAVGSPRVKMYFDVGNVLYLRQGFPEQWIRQLNRKYIARMHFKDAQVGGPINHLLEGAVNWTQVRAAIRDIGYDDWIGLELPLPAHHPEAMLASQHRAMQAIVKGGAA
jgi:hexulose-6-phosphate isomerase